LRELVASDLDHVIVGVGVDVLESVFANGGNEFLVEEEPDVASGVGRSFANVDGEVRRRVREGEVVIDEFAGGEGAAGVFSRGREHGEHADAASRATPARRAEAGAAIRSASVLTVARISDGIDDNRVIAAAIAVNTDVPSVIGRGSDIDASVGLERIVLVIVIEDGGFLILADINIAIAISNNARG